MHIVTGVKTNVITRAEVTPGNAGDSPYFERMVKKTARYFTIKEICADAGYISRKNCMVAEEVGALPFIMPRSNVKRRAGGSYAWRHMIKLWEENKSLFKQHYHARSNVESTFSAIKRKFMPYLRSKTEQGQFNEMLCKVVCHNLSVLVNSVFELDANLHFKYVD